MRNATHAFRGVLVVIVVLGAALSAWAQTRGSGAFASLSPGDQKIARTLFEAQTTSGGATPLTLDPCRRKEERGHTGWGQVFKQTKEQNLVMHESLGQVVSSFERHPPELAAKPDHSKPEELEQPNKPEKMDKPARPERPGR
jgi:hypothetical protein